MSNIDIATLKELTMQEIIERLDILPLVIGFFAGRIIYLEQKGENRIEVAIKLMEAAHCISSARNELLGIKDEG